jgi:hypothetical protein
MIIIISEPTMENFNLSVRVVRDDSGEIVYIPQNDFATSIYHMISKYK